MAAWGNLLSALFNQRREKRSRIFLKLPMPASTVAPRRLQSSRVAARAAAASALDTTRRARAMRPHCPIGSGGRPFGFTSFGQPPRVSSELGLVDRISRAR